MAIIETFGLSRNFGRIVAVQDLTLKIDEGPLLTLALALGITFVDFIALRAAVRLFQRESIIVQWP